MDEMKICWSWLAILKICTERRRRKSQAPKHSLFINCCCKFFPWICVRRKTLQGMLRYQTLPISPKPKDARYRHLLLLLGFNCILSCPDNWEHFWFFKEKIAKSSNTTWKMHWWFWMAHKRKPKWPLDNWSMKFKYLQSHPGHVYRRVSPYSHGD